MRLTAVSWVSVKYFFRLMRLVCVKSLLRLRVCACAAFHACGVGSKFDRCREDYRELCRPIRCLRSTCERESLLECGEKTCRDAYVARCVERKSSSAKVHSEFNEKLTISETIDSNFKAEEDN